MTIPGPLCPMEPDGRHKLKPFAGYKGSRSGLACERCHKTFVWEGEVLVEGVTDGLR